MQTIFDPRKRVFPRICYYLGKIVSSHADRVQTRRLEVECKFPVTPAALSYLRTNGGDSGFKNYKRLGKQTTLDTYYDRNGLLYSKGIYIRQRNGQWEAKIRTSGAAFVEIEGANAVKEVVAQNLTVSAGKVSIKEMLPPCAEFVTTRESWMLDGRFKVDVERTNFGHVVGEVQLMSDLPDAADGEDGEERRDEMKAQMNQEIDAFMQSYPQAFPAGRPLGQLSAYFQSLDIGA